MPNYDRWGIETSPTTAEEPPANTLLTDGGEPSVLDEMDLEAAFEDVPRTVPDDVTLDAARRHYPEAVISEAAPGERVLDPHHQYTAEVTIEVPDWVVASAAWRLSQQHEPDAAALRDIIFESVQITPTFVTTDRKNLAELLLNGGNR